MTCSQCHKMVDPYIEREWLLVVIDCILLREEAYRHVLYNVDELKDIAIPTLLQVVFGHFGCLLEMANNHNDGHSR